MHHFSLLRLPTVSATSQAVAADPTHLRIRAGGLDLFDHFKSGLDAPDALVELQAISGDEGRLLRSISPSQQSLDLGALVTLSELAGARELGRSFAALSHAAGSAATPAIRNVATLGGNLLQRPRCWYYRDPALLCLKKGGERCLSLHGDNRYHAIFGGQPCFMVHPSTLGVALTALDATVILVTDTGRRELNIGDFFVPPRHNIGQETQIAPGEILLQVKLPAPVFDQRSAYTAAKEKQSFDWPLAEAAVRCGLTEGKMTGVRVALGHVAPVPWRCPEAESALEGQAPTADLFARAADLALHGAEPLKHNGYKVVLARGLIRQALHHATGIPLPE